MSVSISGSQITFNDASVQNTAAKVGMVNRIINGAMMIDQRNAGASVTNALGDTFTVDRWKLSCGVASKLTAQQNAASVTSAVGFKNYLGITSTSAYSIGAGDYFVLQQAVEGLNSSDLAWGTANAATVTLSFWIRSSLTGTFGGAIRNSDSSRNYPFTYTISSANTWEQKTITIAGDTTGTWLTTNGTGISVGFGLGVGSTYSGTAGAWTSSVVFSATGATSVVGTNGATFYITGVQLEKGSTATSFDYRPYGTELQLCQRYGYRPDNSAYVGRAQSAGFLYSYPTIVFPVTMRSAPTLESGSSYAVNTGNAGTPGLDGTSTQIANFYNTASNWTVNAVVKITGFLSAEL
jgi:hypothetical protein